MHEIIGLQGKGAALKADLDRNEVEAAAAYLADEDGGVGFLYSGWCQAALPHKRLPDGKGWQIKGEFVTLIVEPGMRPTAGDEPEAVGVPYGSRARLIMLYLQSEALRTRSRDIELGRSLRAWLNRLGIPQGGKSIAAVREQAERISRCRITLQVKMGKATGLLNQNIVDTAIFVSSDEQRQTNLFAETAKLSEGFYNQLQKHSVPLEEAAIRAINNNSMALDVYCWLAYRLHSLEASRPITWQALKTQFGAGYGNLKNFRAPFTINLRLAMAVYPAARLDIDERGVTLHPSAAPVSADRVPARRLMKSPAIPTLFGL